MDRKQYLADVTGWLHRVRQTSGGRGQMDTPWLKKYELLGYFGDLLR